MYRIVINGCIVHAEAVRSAFLFVGYLNGHTPEWLGSMTTNHHGVADFDFSTVFGCDQLVVDTTHARGGTLDLLMTNDRGTLDLLMTNEELLIC